MSKEIKEYVSEIHELFDEVSDKVEDSAADFADDARELWGETKQQLQKVKKRLGDVEHYAKQSTQDAKLQTHLAAMDAHDHWQDLKHNIDSFVIHTQHKAKRPIDHAVLQAYLAKMEARDFMNEKGRKLTDDFNRSAVKSLELSRHAAADIKESCDGLIAGLPK